MFLHISTSARCDFNTNVNCVKALAEIMCAFVNVVEKMTNRELEQRVNIKCCLKLGKIGSKTYAKLSEACGAGKCE